MFYLYKKELESYFNTPFGFVFMGIFLLLSGLSFTTSNLLGGNGDLAGMFGLLSSMSFMTFPILTMKLFAEERKAGTEQLLLSSRLSATKIVLGKYLAALTVFAITLLMLVIYVGIIVTYGSPNMGSIFASFLGFFLLGAAMIAVCVFAASMVESQVTAAIAGFGILFVLVMLPTFSNSLQIPVISNVLSAIAISARYDEFVRGIFSLGPVCYYIGYTFVLLFLTVKSIQRKRIG
ncbi:MAG: ABC transporter permease subunit [Christensenellaceae bacterium]